MADQRKSFLKDNWKKYLFELLVIITGITLSFGLQNWRENQQMRHLEIQTLERLLTDLAADTLDLNGEIKSLTYCMENSRKLIKIKKLEEASDSLGMFLASQMQYTLFSKSDIAYQGLRQNGRSNLISNQELLNKIIRQYAVSYRALDELSEIDKNFILQEYLPFFNRSFPFLANAKPDEVVKKLTPVMTSDSFRNLTNFNFTIKAQVIEKYTEALESIAELMAAIKEELKTLK